MDTALRLFRERGYQATTMRLIATEAGVSPGNAYYYFDGKDELVQELYVRIQHEHREAAMPRLCPGAGLADNLRTVFDTGLDTMAPYHGFGATMLQVALSTSAAVSPFSAASRQARDAAVGLLAEAAGMSRGVPGGALGERLPRLLWLAYLGITLHWVCDNSPEQRRTRDLVAGAAPLIARAASLARLPGGRAFATDLVRLVDQVSPTPHHDRQD